MIQTKQSKANVQNKKLFVQLSSAIADEKMPYLSTNAKIEEVNKPDGFAYFEVYSLKDASNLCQNFIKQYNLGSSNWTGGLVVDENQEFIAHISYNGRAWDHPNYFLAKEIEVD